MRYPVLNGPHTEVPEPNTYGNTWSKTPATPARPGGMPMMTSGWGPAPAGARPISSNNWFGRTAFVPMPGGEGTYPAVTGF